MANVEQVLLLGNGINRITPVKKVGAVEIEKSWDGLLKHLHENYYDKNSNFSEFRAKPFPLVFEQVVLYNMARGKLKIEGELKKVIASIVLSFERNEIHNLVANDSKFKHIITPSYEFNFIPKDLLPKRLKNEGCVKEQKFSLFRHFKINNKTYWHPHGDSSHTYSVNLGYEHYSGQLQYMRNYVVSSYETNYDKLNEVFKKGLISRSYVKEKKPYSWVDFFFMPDTHIKIIGFGLDFQEIDFWWLLNFRAKKLYELGKAGIRNKNNKIKYYINKRHVRQDDLAAYNMKKELLEKMLVDVVELDIADGEEYYRRAIYK